MRNLLGLITRRGRAVGVYFKDSPDPPPAPNYAAAAQAQGAANIDAGRLSARMNRPDEFTPLGSRTWRDLGNDRMASTISLTPEGQALYDQQERISSGLGSASEQALGRVQNTFNTPFSRSPFEAAQGQAFARAQGTLSRPMSSMDRNAYADALLSRAERRMDQDEEGLRSRLMAQGINPGSEAWSREFDVFNQGRNDMRIQAYLQAGQEMGQDISRQQAIRNQALSELSGLGSEIGQDMQRQAYLRNIPLSELNALRTGAQPNMPQFQAYGGAGQVQPAPIFGAAQAGYGAQMDQYNAQAAQRGNFMSGLFGLGGAALGSPWMFK